MMALGGTTEPLVSLQNLGTNNVEGMRTFVVWEMQAIYCVLLDRGDMENIINSL